MPHHTKTPAEARADQLADETRRVRKFDEMEAKIASKQTTFSSPTANKFLSYLGSRNPFGKPVTNDDVVWLLDNTAFQTSSGAWHAEFVAAVFERDERPKETDLVTSVAKMLGLNDNPVEKKTIETRMLPFMWQVRPSRKITVLHHGKQLTLGPTGPNGISSDIISLPGQPSGTLLRSNAKMSRSAIGILEMTTFFAGPEGWAVISGMALDTERALLVAPAC